MCGLLRAHAGHRFARDLLREALNRFLKNEFDLAIVLELYYEL
ncbi:MAG: hypothetical protein ACXW0L_07250 [Methylosarcina sp.]